MFENVVVHYWTWRPTLSCSILFRLIFTRENALLIFLSVSLQKLTVYLLLSIFSYCFILNLIISWFYFYFYLLWGIYLFFINVFDDNLSIVRKQYLIFSNVKHQFILVFDFQTCKMSNLYWPRHCKFANSQFERLFSYLFCLFCDMALKRNWCIFIAKHSRYILCYLSLSQIL